MIGLVFFDQDVAVDDHAAIPYIHIKTFVGNGMGLTFTDPVADVNPSTTHDIFGDPLIHSATIAVGGESSDWRITRIYDEQYQTDGNGNKTRVAYTVDYFVVDTDGHAIEGGGPERVDNLEDSAANDHITSGGGDDIIYAFRGGDDVIEAGAGRDRVYDYYDIIDGGDGDAANDELIHGWRIAA